MEAVPVKRYQGVEAKAKQYRFDELQRLINQLDDGGPERQRRLAAAEQRELEKRRKAALTRWELDRAEELAERKLSQERIERLANAKANNRRDTW